MKRWILVWLMVLAVAATKGQVVSSVPAFAVENAAVTLTFDATLGNKGLMGFAGDVYAHIGVITNLSTGDSDWKYVKAAWNVNIAACKLTPLGNNKWQLVISPDIRSYFGITNSNETVKKIALVFRSADGSKTGRDTGDKDIFVTVYQPGLNVSLTSPAAKVSLAAKSTAMTLSATASQPATLKLFVNSTQVGSTATNAASISTSYTFGTEGNYYVIAEISNGTTTRRDSAYVCVRPASAPVAARPSGLKDGINYQSDTQVTLSLFAKGKSYIYLLGEMNDWKPDNAYMLKKDGDYFWITLTGLTPGREYGFQYFVDGTVRCGDPYSEKILDPWNDKWINEKRLVYPNLKPYPTGKTDDVVSVFQTAKPAYNWQVSNFAPPAKESMVIYELHVRDFTEAGTVSAATEKLDYLQALGVNTIELMPVNEFDGNDSWGYNPNFWMAPDKAYGTPDDYKRFVDECHKRGMAVVLDVVFNHSWGLSPMAKMWWDGTNNRPSTSNPYLFPIAMHPYNVGSDFNHSSIYTRNYFKEVLKYWLNEYRVDGYRFDLSKGLTPETFYTADVNTWGNYNQGRIDILKEYHQTIKTTNPNAVTILEHFAANDEEIALANEGMMLWGNSNYAFGQSAKAVQQGSDMSWLTAAGRGWTKQNLVGYMESHDEERLAYRALNEGIAEIKSDSALRMRQLAACAALFLTAPGPKMIWQFGELGYDTSIDYNGRTGRKPVRWDYLNYAGRKELRDNYAAILKLRKQYPALFANPTTQSRYVGSNDWNNGKTALLSNAEISAVVAANYTGNSTVTAYPGFPKSGLWYDLISGESLNVTNTAMGIALPAGSYIIYTDKPVVINSIPKTESESVSVYPNPVRGQLFLKGAQATAIELCNANGVLVMQRPVENNRVQLDELPAGYYTARIKLSDNRYNTVKIIKIK